MPIAKPDTARTPRGVPVVIAVLSNDQGGSLTVAGYTLPTAGTLVLNPDQTFTYTPTAAGSDSVAITLGGTDISGSPYASEVSGAPAPGSFSNAQLGLVCVG